MSENDDEQKTNRMRLPNEKDKEVLGIVVSLLGAGRLLVSCSDGKERVCRIPGKMRRFIWVRENNYVIVKPWDIEGDSKGDVVWRYNKFQEEWLKKNGHLKNIDL
ncbi:MAG: translation initiation factor eIF-1A [Candidatus Micrarchaeia archaeon]|jgi:translation initiation factor 1A